ncbi:O-antigen ligase family protein [bacterium]|nr:O-antigen ligase family protein [bacterium]
MDTSANTIFGKLKSKDYGYMLMLFWRSIFIMGLLLFAFILGVVPQMVKPDVLPMIIAGYVIIILCAISILKPLLLVYFTVISASTSTIVKNIGNMNVGGTTMSTSGMRWALITFIAGVINLYYFRNKGIQRKYWLYMVFLAYGVVIYIVKGSAGTGDKDLVWYALPMIIGMFTYNYFLNADLKRFEHNDWLIRNNVFIVMWMFGWFFATGGLVMTANGPDGDVVARTVALFTSTILPIPLARWRYHPDPKQRRIGLVYSLLFLGTVFITLSRMALGTGMMLVVISRNRPRHFMRLVTAVLVGGTLIVSLFVAVPAFRARMFKNGRLPQNMTEFLITFDSSGRFSKLWPHTVASAMDSPIFGQGPGTARRNIGEAMTAQKVQQEYPPHNEYLQVWHDFGVVGAGILLIFYVYLTLQLWFRWKFHDDRGNYVQAYWSMAGFLSIFLIAFSSLTANTLHYPFVMAMAFMIMGMSDAMHDRFIQEHHNQMMPDEKNPLRLKSMFVFTR